MTDERIIQRPASRTDEIDADQGRDAESSDPRPNPGEDNPLLREGADALDAADIEDPDEQL